MVDRMVGFSTIAWLLQMERHACKTRPACCHRASEILSNVVRYHVTACFGALEERVMAMLSTAAQRAQHGAQYPTPRPIAHVDRTYTAGNRRAVAPAMLQSLVQCRAATQATLKVGVDALLGDLKVCHRGWSCVSVHESLCVQASTLTTQAYEQCSWLMAAWQGDFSPTVAGQLQQLVAQLRQRVVALAAACQAPAAPSHQDTTGEPEGGPVGGPVRGPVGGSVLQGPVRELARERSGGLQGDALFGSALPSYVC